MKRQRSKNLTHEDVELIVGVLDGWRDALTWNLLIDSVERRLFFRYTRQTLHAHQRIKDAFKLSKERLARAPRSPGQKHISPEMLIFIDRLARRDAEVTRLKAENQQLMEQFVVWLYNAQTKAISLAELEKPLPRVDRGQTKTELRLVGHGRRPQRT